VEKLIDVGITPRAIAFCLNVDEDTIDDWRAGNPRQHHPANAITLALLVSMADLLSALYGSQEVCRNLALSKYGGRIVARLFQARDHDTLEELLTHLKFLLEMRSKAPVPPMRRPV
jgi:hypothetical protein